jgi:hypothetical protein
MSVGGGAGQFPMQGQRMFFSEEKNQKTFAPALADGSRPWPERGEAAPEPLEN